ncbi:MULTISPECIES: hypothetical protein [Streptomyces]|uniref:hypothetical protein n=1 Tax=Streptomyces TaxID=1883 RepID=UPI0019627EBC|nr:MULTISPECIES: hypothetical protein [Streptomyces]
MNFSQLRCARVLLIGSIIFLGGCEAPSEPVRSTPQPESSSGRSYSDKALRLPIDEYSVSPEDHAVVQKAKIILANACLKRLGSSYSLPPAEDPAEDAEISRRYGISDRATAARYGYHMPSAAPAADEKLKPLSDDEKRLVFGEQGDGESAEGESVPDGGCFGEAEAKINEAGVPEAAISFASQVNRESFERSIGDERVDVVVKAWSKCMAESGYSYDSPLESVGDEKFHSSEKAGAEEKRVALTDLDCKGRVGLIEKWGSVEAGMQKEAMKRDPEKLIQLKAFQESQLRNARKALSGS